MACARPDDVTLEPETMARHPADPTADILDVLP